MHDWMPIDTAPQNLWQPTIIHLRSESGQEAMGSYGWDDEYLLDDGDVMIVGAWHADDDCCTYLPFDPIEWKPIEESENV